MMTPRLAPSLLAAAALAILASGCRKDNTSFVEPYSLCSMPADCTFGATCDAQPIGPLVFDPSGGEEMWLAIEMHNQLADNSDRASGRVNTHDAHFESYSLEYGGDLSGSTGSIAAASDRTQQVIPAGGTSVIGITAFPHSVIAGLTGVPTAPNYARVDVTATLKGRYDDGSKWETPFDFSVRLSLGGVAATCDDATKVPVSACPSLFQSPHGTPKCQ